MPTYRGLQEKFDAAYEIKRQLRDLRESIESRAPSLGSDIVTISDIRSGSIPPYPTGFTATPSAGLITLTWNTVNVPNLSHYEVQASTNQAFADATTEFTTNSFWTYDEGTVGTTYYFRVRAANTQGGRSVWTTAISSSPTKFDSSETPGLPGSLVLIDSVELSSSSYYDTDARVGSDVMDNSLYSMYEIELVDLVPATDAVDLYMRVYYDGNLKTANYRWVINEFDTGGAFYTRTGASGQAEFKLTTTGGQLGTGTHESLSGTIWLFCNPYLGSTVHNVFHHSEFSLLDSAGVYTGWISMGMNNNTADSALTGLRIYMSSGNIASGRIRVYGWKIA